MKKKYIIGILVSLSIIGMLSGMQYQIHTLKQQISAQMQSMTELISGMEYESAWAGKTWCSYGDSITQEAMWQKYITEYFGFAKHYERGIGSCTYVKNGQTWYANEDGTYNSRRGFAGVWDAPEGTTEHEGWMCSWDRITTMIPKDVDLVVVMAGTNDAGQSSGSIMGDGSVPYDETTFKGAVALTITRIQEWVPNATVVVCTPLSGRGLYQEGMSVDEDMNDNQMEVVYNNLGYTTEDYADAVMEVARSLSVPVIDVFGETGINQQNREIYIRDLVHPTESGGRAIANVIIGKLKEMEPIY